MMSRCTAIGLSRLPILTSFYPMLFIGIDSGTQSTKSVVLDFETGAIVAHASEKYDVIDGLPPGHMEQQPATWTKAVAAGIRAPCRRGFEKP